MSKELAGYKEVTIDKDLMVDYIQYNSGISERVIRQVLHERTRYIEFVTGMEVETVWGKS